MDTATILAGAVAAKRIMACADTEIKNRALTKAAELLLDNTDRLLAANATDIENARGSISEVMIDRLTLTAQRIKDMASAILDVASLPDPVGEVESSSVNKNGLTINRVCVPIGVIAVIYESRPNVTGDAAALLLKSGNVCVLRGGKEAINANIVIVDIFREALEAVGLPQNAVNLITDTTRAGSYELMTAVGKVDLLIPRGGKGLIKACVENAKVPCIETGTGICHIYIDETADIGKALDIIDNAKTSRPSVCNAAEVCLLNKNIAARFLPMLRQRLVDDRAKAGKQPVELRLDARAAELISGTPAGENDFDTEFLDYILAVKVVDDVRQAVEHIAVHSTGHSEAIVTQNPDNADYFTRNVDSAAVYVNASTRFTDGGVFGLGCEIGISTQKMHARGPMGLKEMTIYKYVVQGNGQIRK